MTSYMFDPQLSLLTRGLSFFHFWLPIVLVWLVWRLGYDRTFPAWTVLACGLVLVCYFWMPAPPATVDQPNLPVNINYVYGFSSEHPQTLLPQPVYLALLLVLLLMAIFWPTHLVLRKIAKPPDPVTAGAAAWMGRAA